jgi:predicted amidohydrolase YtcJ
MSRNSRRDFFKAGAAAGLGAALPAASAKQTGGPRSGGDDDLTLVNGRIHTLDDRNTIVSSVAIRNGRFVSVGNAASPGPGAKVINLHGRTVIPGIVEGHVHVVSLANRPGYHVPLEMTTTIREVQEALAARRPGVPEGQWITSMGGWHPFQWVDVRRRPTRAELDAAVPDRPVFLYERFTGPAVVNSMGKAIFDAIDAGPLPHPAAVKINTAADGSIAAGGFAGGGAAITALFVLRTLQTFEDKLRSTRDAMAYAAGVGLTAMLDHVLFPTPGPLHPHQVLSNLDHYRMYDSWLELHRRGESLVRLQMNFLHNQSDPNLPELKERLKNSFQFFGGDMMMTGSSGEWAAPIGAGATWFEAQRLVAQAGWRNENSVGSLAQLAQVVDAYEKVDAEFGIRGLRWMVHHVPFVSTELLGRLQALGCGVQMAAFRWVTAGAGATNVGAPFRTIVDHGIQVGIHGDGAHIAPLSPWPHIYYATTGVSSFGQQVNPGQQLSRLEALRLFTRGNAWFMKMEDKIGSIEEGKLGDLLVLNHDYFAVRDEDIRKTRPVLTVVGGRIVHDAGAL